MWSSVTWTTRSSSRLALACVRLPTTKARTTRHTGAKAIQIQASPYVSHTSLALIRFCSLVCTKLHNEIGLAFGHGQPLPQVEHDQSALHRCTVQPGTGSIFIDLDDPASGTQGIAFSQRTDRGVKKR